MTGQVPDLWQRLSQTSDEQEFLDTWLSCLTVCCGSVRRAHLVWGDAANVGPFHPRAAVPAGAVPDRLLADMCERVMELRLPLTQTVPRALLVHPVMLDADLHGVVALEFDGVLPTNAHQALDWGMGWLRERLARSESETADALRERLFVMLDVLTHVIDDGKAVTAAQSVATELAQHLGCERVSVGFGKT